MAGRYLAASMVAAQTRADSVAESNRTCKIPEVRILGCRIHRVGLSESAEILLQCCLEGPRVRVVTADSFGLLLASKDPPFRDIINSADLVTPDSAGVVWASRVLRCPIQERVPGIDLVVEMMRRGASCGLRVFLLGAAPGVAEEAGIALARHHSGLQVVGTHHGFFRDAEDPYVIEVINNAAPQLLLCAMGIPKQDIWLRRNFNRLNANVLIGVGGTLDVLSGRIRRAPSWMQRRGLEWLHRLIVNPRKLAKCTALPRFILAVLAERTRLRHHPALPLS